MFERICTWKFDNDYDKYDTACQESYCFEAGTLKENHYYYCPACGGRIYVKGKWVGIGSKADYSEREIASAKCASQ
jgi:DNA-directed RNA polymerase subunit RPC12/RpoP